MDFWNGFFWEKIENAQKVKPKKFYKAEYWTQNRETLIPHIAPQSELGFYMPELHEVELHYRNECTRPRSYWNLSRTNSLYDMPLPSLCGKKDAGSKV